MNDWIEILEAAANDPKLPGFATDWACEVYALLQSRGNAAKVLVGDLLVLDKWKAEGRDAGLFALDAWLPRRPPA